MATTENKAVVRRFFEEIFNQQDRLAAEAWIAPDFVAHHPGFPQGIRGPDGIMQTVAMFRAGFPDLHYTVEDLIAEGGKVTARWVARGTHRGEFLGVPATGTQVQITGIDIFRVADGHLVEAWVLSDFLGLLQQLGAIPAPGQAADGERRQ